MKSSRNKGKEKNENEELKTDNTNNKDHVLRGYRKLSVLAKHKYKYTPFYQSAIAHAFDDKDWEGSCHVLSYDWMYRKISEEDINTVTTYKIENPFVPHPMNVGDNDERGEQITSIQQALSRPKNKSKRHKRKGVQYWNRDSLEEGTAYLLDYIGSEENHYGVIGVRLSLKYKNEECSKTTGHAVAFVKRGNTISWFDPNHGEVTFKNFEDFKTWFSEEAAHGVLQYIIPTEKDQVIRNKFGRDNFHDVFSAPVPTKEETEISSPFTKKKNEIRSDDKKPRTVVGYLIDGFMITSFSTKKYTKPEEITPVGTQPASYSLEEKKDILRRAKVEVEKDEYDNLGVGVFGFKITPHHIKSFRKLLAKVESIEDPEKINGLYNKYAKLVHESIKCHDHRVLRLQLLYNSMHLEVYPITSTILSDKNDKYLLKKK